MSTAETPPTTPDLAPGRPATTPATPPTSEITSPKKTAKPGDAPERKSGKRRRRGKEPILRPQAHGGALWSGGKDSEVATVKRVRRKLMAQLEDVAEDLERMLEQARIWEGQEGKRPRCEACGAILPGVVNLKLPDILAVIRELRAILPSQHEIAGVFANVDVRQLPDALVARLADGEDPASVLVGYLPGVEDEGA